MASQSKDWKIALEKWLREHPKVMPVDLQQLREEFVQRFPKEQLSSMPLDRYAIGKSDSFCYWLEFKTKELGSISGGSAAKFGVWWSKNENRWRWNSIYQSAEDAMQRIKDGLFAMAQSAGEVDARELDKLGAQHLGPNRYSLRAKPLYLYFPDHFLPISHPNHLKYFLTQFEQQPKGDLLTLNMQLLGHLRSLSEFAGFDTRQLMLFLYTCLRPGETVTQAAPTIKEQSIETASTSQRTKVFISYSHKDAPLLERLRVHLAPYGQNKLVDAWVDTMIKPGAKWRDEVQKAIDSAKVAVLLVSADYLASPFIVENELPPILAAAEQEGTTILPVIISPCAFEQTELAQFQAVNSPSTPLAKMSKYHKEALWDKLARVIKDAASS